MQFRFVLLVPAVLFSTLQAAEATAIQIQDDEAYSRELVNINGTLFFFSNIKADAYQAIITCQDFGMKLLSIQSEAKKHMILPYLTSTEHRSKMFWTSGVRFLSDNFIWSANGEPLGFTDWSEFQPDEDPAFQDVCIYLGAGDARDWFDMKCQSVINFVCEEVKPACN